MEDKEKTFTWADLKRAINKMPAKQLKKAVTIWTDDESCYLVSGVEVLKEDYLHDGDEGCMKRSLLKDAMSEKEWKEDKDDYHLVHSKGTRIINAS